VTLSQPRITNDPNAAIRERNLGGAVRASQIRAKYYFQFAIPIPLSELVRLAARGEVDVEPA
jgi:hypothetical protein